jgi:hypothetical protein
MPNWTDVRVAITHDDATKISELRDIFEDASPFQQIKPMPEDVYRGDLSHEDRKHLGRNNWYDWSIDNWGTKWEPIGVRVRQEDDHTLSVNMLTAWSPPDGIFNELVTQGFNIHAQYLDEGWCYIGEYIDGASESWSAIEESPEYLREEFSVVLEEENE